MATQREYLVSLGLAQEGRGRFSRDAKAALQAALAGGMTFDDPACVVVKQPKPKVESKANFSAEISAEISEDSKPVEFQLPQARRVRKNARLFGLTDEGHKVGFSHCRRCANYMAFCTCASLLPPSIVSQGFDGKPWRMVECNTQPWKSTAGSIDGTD